MKNAGVSSASNKRSQQSMANEGQGDSLLDFVGRQTSTIEEEHEDSEAQRSGQVGVQSVRTAKFLDDSKQNVRTNFGSSTPGGTIGNAFSNSEDSNQLLKNKMKSPNK